MFAMQKFSGMLGQQGGGASSVQSFSDTIQSLGIGADLACCLDAGDIASYDGTSQTWFDTSGGSNNYFLGPNNTVNSSDPVFTGTAGDLSAGTYFGFSASQYFQETTSQSFAEGASGFHSATAGFTIIFILEPASVGVQYLWGNRTISPTGSIGAVFSINASSRPWLRMSGDGSTDGVATTGDATVVPIASVPNMIGVTWATGGAMQYKTNSALHSLTDAMSAASSTAPSQANRIARDVAGGTGNIPVGSKLYGVVIAKRAWTSTELDDFYNAIKLRFPAMP